MKRTEQPKGFTIVEMLTVMGIIAVLIGLLIPALSQVKDYSKQIQQKAQFHSINVAMEMFKAEFGSYPESNNNLDVLDGTSSKAADQNPYCGANKMAEALVGLDLLGFHPNSDFRTTGENMVVNDLGAPVLTKVYWAYGNTPNWQTAKENIQARKGPFLELENANAYRMNEIYPALPGGWAGNYVTPAGNQYPLALCDVFAKTRSGTGNKKTGMPILYYRARTTYSLQDFNTLDPVSNKNDDVYYFPDNSHILALGTPETTPVAHPLYDATGEALENAILNKQLSPVKRPYRAGSYILISAGKDGLYGTADDIFNFDKGTEQ